MDVLICKLMYTFCIICTRVVQFCISLNFSVTIGIMHVYNIKIWYKKLKNKTQWLSFRFEQRVWWEAFNEQLIVVSCGLIQ